MENLGEFIVNHWVLSTAFVILLWLVFSDAVLRRFSGVQQVDVNQAVRLSNQLKGRFVDVREADEFNKAHIADAINIPVAQLADNVSVKLKDKSRPVILVCASGQRAKNAAKPFRQQGFEQVYVLSGGLHAWKEAKLPLFD